MARDDDELLVVLVVDGQLAARHAEERDRPLQHRLQQLRQLQLAGEVRQGVQQRPLLLGPLVLHREEAGVLDGDRGLRREHVQQSEVRIDEGAVRFRVHAGECADQPVPDQERDHHDAPGRGLLVLLRPAAPLLVVGDDQRLVRLGHPSHRALAESHSGARGVAADVVAGDDLQLTRTLVIDGELATGHAEQRDGPLHNALQELRELELAREVGERLQQSAVLLGVPALGSQESHPTDGDPRLLGRGGQHVEVAVVEGVGLAALHHQHAHQLLVVEDGHIDLGARAERRDVARYVGDPRSVVELPVVDGPGRDPFARRDPHSLRRSLPADAGLEDPVARRLVDEEDAQEVVAQGRVVQALDHAPADLVLGMGRGDGRAQAQERSLACMERSRFGSPGGHAVALRMHGGSDEGYDYLVGPCPGCKISAPSRGWRRRPPRPIVGALQDRVPEWSLNPSRSLTCREPRSSAPDSTSPTTW